MIDKSVLLATTALSIVITTVIVATQFYRKQHQQQNKKEEELVPPQQALPPTPKNSLALDNHAGTSSSTLQLPEETVMKYKEVLNTQPVEEEILPATEVNPSLNKKKLATMQSTIPEEDEPVFEEIEDKTNEKIDEDNTEEKQPEENKTDEKLEEKVEEPGDAEFVPTKMSVDD